MLIETPVLARHTRHLNRAIEIAKTSKYRWQHGAVLTKGNKVLAVAPNKTRNSPWQCPNAATVHAEQAVIKELRGNDLSDCTIYVARVDKKGNPAMSRPCAECMKTIISVDIRTIIYTNEAGSMSIEKVIR